MMLSTIGFLEDLKEMLGSDADAQVVANCLSVLQQVHSFKSFRLEIILIAFTS